MTAAAVILLLTLSQIELDKIEDPIADFVHFNPQFEDKEVEIEDVERVYADIDADGIREILLRNTALRGNTGPGVWWTVYVQRGDTYARLRSSARFRTDAFYVGPMEGVDDTRLFSYRAVGASEGSIIAIKLKGDKILHEKIKTIYPVWRDQSDPDYEFFQKTFAHSHEYLELIPSNVVDPTEHYISRFKLAGTDLQVYRLVADVTGDGKHDVMLSNSRITNAKGGYIWDFYIATDDGYKVLQLGFQMVSFHPLGYYIGYFEESEESTGPSIVSYLSGGASGGTLYRLKVTENGITKSNIRDIRPRWEDKELFNSLFVRDDQPKIEEFPASEADKHPLPRVASIQEPAGDAENAIAGEIAPDPELVDSITGLSSKDVPRLLEELVDPTLGTRTRVLHTLKRIGDKRATVPILNLLKSGRLQDVEWDAITALIGLNDPAAEAHLLALAKNDDTWVPLRLDLCSHLAQHGSEQAKRYAAEFILDIKRIVELNNALPQGEGRGVTFGSLYSSWIDALFALGTEEAIYQVIGVMDRGAYYLYVTKCVTKLADIEDPTRPIIDALMRRAQDAKEQRFIRINAVTALTNYGDAVSREEIRQCVETLPTNLVDKWQAEAVSKFREEYGLEPAP